MRDEASVPVLEAAVAAILLLVVLLLASTIRPPHVAVSAPDTPDETVVLTRLVSAGLDGVATASWDPLSDGWLDEVVTGNTATVDAVATHFDQQLGSGTRYHLRLATGFGTVPLVGREPPSHVATRVATAWVLPDWRGLVGLGAASWSGAPGDALDSSSWQCLLAPQHQVPPGADPANAASGRGPDGVPWVTRWTQESTTHVPTGVPYGTYLAFLGGTTDPSGACTDVTNPFEVLVHPPGHAGLTVPAHALDLVVWRG